MNFITFFLFYFENFQFENADETIQFKLEQFQLTCDVLREHINKCNQRAEEINRQIANESLSKK